MTTSACGLHLVYIMRHLHLCTTYTLSSHGYYYLSLSSSPSFHPYLSICSLSVKPSIRLIVYWHRLLVL